MRNWTCAHYAHARVQMAENEAPTSSTSQEPRKSISKTDLDTIESLEDYVESSVMLQYNNR